MTSHNYHRKLSSAPKNSHRFRNKRKIEFEEEEEGGGSTGRLDFDSSTSKRCPINQCTFYEFNSTQEVRRKWTYSSRDFSGVEERLVIVSYNVLGVANASLHPDLYHNISPEHMDWNHRKAVIYKELAQYDPSILCFQEVDRFSDLQVSLLERGFEGILKARTGDACDGCAIFWKSERLLLLHQEQMEFQSFGLRNNVSQFCIFKIADTCRRLIVGNIHVLFNPKRGDIKLAQVSNEQIRLFLEKAFRLSEEWGGIPIILAGDFNSIPQSAVYQYITSGKLDLLQHARHCVSGQIATPPYERTFGSLTSQSHSRQRLSGWNDEDLKLATGGEGTTCVQHNLKLHSAYRCVPGSLMTRDDIGEPLGTTCHSQFTGTVDYIWYTKGLVPVRVLETLPKNAFWKMGGLPSEIWGSDHLALVCDFAFSDDELSEE